MQPESPLRPVSDMREHGPADYEAVGVSPSGPGHSAEPEPMPVSAVPAGVPDAETLEEIFALIRDLPANGRPAPTPARGWAEHFRFIEYRTITKACHACGHQKLDYSYYKVTPAGKAALYFAQAMSARQSQDPQGLGPEAASAVAEGHAPTPEPTHD